MTIRTENAASIAAASLDARQVEAFRRLVYDYYYAYPRPLPWRETDDPYHILLSEIMLQQTQVERVKLKYAQFLERFPLISDMAEAPLAEVLHYWQGLGYNRRALNLHRCARVIVDEYNGRLPASVAALEKLPGIGPYTARAVAAFAFGIAEPLIETNIRTVFIHFFGGERNDVHDRELMPLIAATLDQERPRAWYYALMDYGVMLKQTQPNPGRRSRHHTRQSRFEGSKRQLRSRLLREVLGKPGITLAALAECVNKEPEVVAQVITALAQEGFVTVQGDGYAIVKTNGV